jgi:hypothetical protein
MMANNPMNSMFEEQLEKLFITDKRGSMLFFPYTSRKKGYYLDDPGTQDKFIKLFSNLMWVYLAVVSILSVLFRRPGLMFIFFLAYPLAYLLIYRIYVSMITRSLERTTKSYSEIILEKLESEALAQEDEEESEMEYPAPVRPKIRIQPVKSDPFLKIKRLYYRLSAGHLAFISGSIAVAILVIHPLKFSDLPQDYFYIFWVCLLFGFSGFIITINADTSESNESWYQKYLQARLMSFLVMVGCWGGALYALVKWFVLVALNSIVDVLLR